MIKKVIGAFALSMLFAVQANAATIAFTGPSDVLIGDTITLEIVGNFDDVGGLAGGGGDLGWDSSLVSLDSVVLAFGDPGFSCPGAAGCPADTDSSSTIAWGNFGGLIAPGAGDTVMATLTFSLTGATGLALFTLENAAGLLGGWFDFAFANDATPEPFASGGMLEFGVNVDTAVIPLPAAVWLMIGGLGTLLGFRRK